MKRETKIKLTKLTGIIEITIGIIMVGITLIIQDSPLAIKSFILSILILGIGMVFILFPELISGVSKAQTQADSEESVS